MVIGGRNLGCCGGSDVRLYLIVIVFGRSVASLDVGIGGVPSTRHVNFGWPVTARCILASLFDQIGQFGEFFLCVGSLLSGAATTPPDEYFLRILSAFGLAQLGLEGILDAPDDGDRAAY